jgi:hypothetical protein
MTQVVIIFIFLKVKDSKPEFAWVVQIAIAYCNEHFYYFANCIVYYVNAEYRGGSKGSSE